MNFVDWGDEENLACKSLTSHEIQRRGMWLVPVDTVKSMKAGSTGGNQGHPARLLSWLTYCPIHQKVVLSTPRQGTYGRQPMCVVSHIDVSLYLSLLPPSLFLSLFSSLSKKYQLINISSGEVKIK